MRLEAATRLKALSDDPNIRNKQKQIELLRNSLPSRQNRRSMSPVQRLNTRKRILDLQDQIVNVRLKDANQQQNSKT